MDAGRMVKDRLLPVAQLAACPSTVSTPGPDGAPSVGSSGRNRAKGQSPGGGWRVWYRNGARCRLTRVVTHGGTGEAGMATRVTPIPDRRGAPEPPPSPLSTRPNSADVGKPKIAPPPRPVPHDWVL